ncbi:MAG: hypothetical protein AB1813_12160 [Verrucomicrobiota bacterium]
MWTAKLKFIALGLSLTFLTVGCSTFHRDWREAAKTPPPPNDITGRWDGRWISQVNGHNGRLRCLISKTGDGSYSARFHAKYKKILSFGYTVPLTAKTESGKWVFEGQADLGKLAGGLYTYKGNASPTEFFSIYDSKYDRGTFEMTRPAK